MNEPLLVGLDNYVGKRNLFDLAKLFFPGNRCFYLDEKLDYEYQLKSYSKVGGKFFKDIVKIDQEEMSSREEYNIIKSTVVDDEDGLVLFAGVKKEFLRDQLRILHERKIHLDYYYPVEYMVGLFMEEVFGNENTEVFFILKRQVYYSIIRKGRLCWVSRKEKNIKLNEEKMIIDEMEQEVSLKEILNHDRFKKEVIYWDKQHDSEYGTKYIGDFKKKQGKMKDIEKIFWKWMEVKK